jgi:UDP-N-acetyl-D-galactosamine dehydrogenase
MKKILPCVIGLGYVGLPVFISLKKKFNVVGYDVNYSRIKNLKLLKDTNNEFKKNDLKIKNNSIITNKFKDIEKCNFFIVAVPTPLKSKNKPDLKYIFSAFKTISKVIKKNDIVFLESTVFPGTTETICKKILLSNKNKITKEDFFLGYSSERINPGDRKYNLKNISKVVSINANKKIISRVKKIYNNVSRKIVISKKIKEAELSKLIENTQRDLNISLMNEIMILCNKTNLDFNEVIKLAKTKWNFLKFEPGLVGGHCLPVDPYYLSDYAAKSKYKTKVTLAGREINNSMENFITNLILKKISKINKFPTKKILVAGLTYKPNVSDLRNSLAIKIFLNIKRKLKNVTAYDPIVDKLSAKKLKIKTEFKNVKSKDIIIFLVNHTSFKKNCIYFKRRKKTIIDPFSFF